MDIARRKVIHMNFNNKKTRRIFAMIIVVLIIAMVAGSVIPPLLT